MQSKDIPERPILQFLLELDVPANCFELRFVNPESVLHAMPKDTPGKVALAKMGALIKRGLVNGCTCGCRGDFCITERGKEWLNVKYFENRGTVFSSNENPFAS